jgi:hypothetical protein
MPSDKSRIIPRINVKRDKERKKTCISLFELQNGFQCMVMHGPPPLMAELGETWEDAYDAYCCRCHRFKPNNIRELKHCARQMYLSLGWSCEYHDSTNNCMKDCPEFLSSVFALSYTDLKTRGPNFYKDDL